MKKIAINVEYNGKNITSDYAEFTEEETEQLKEFCTAAVSGKLSFLKIGSDNKEFYFPKQIFEQSIISLVYGN